MNDSDETLPTSPSLTRRRRTFLAPLWLMWLLAMGDPASACVRSSTGTRPPPRPSCWCATPKRSSAPFPTRRCHRGRAARRRGSRRCSATPSPSAACTDLRDQHAPHAADRAAVSRSASASNSEVVDAKTDAGGARATRAAREPWRPRTHRGAQQHRPDIVEALSAREERAADRRRRVRHAVRRHRAQHRHGVRPADEVLSRAFCCLARFDGLLDEVLVLGDREVRLHASR